MTFRRLPAALCCLLVSALGFSQTRPHNFDLLDVKWHVDLKTYESTGVLNGDVVNTLKVLADPASVTFDCAKLTVDKVEVNDAAATFSTDGKMITVNLPAGTAVGATLRVHVYYHGSPEAGMYLIPGSRAFPAHTTVIYTQGEMVDNRYWLPTWDYPDDKATSEGFIEVAKGETAVSNGKLIEVKQLPDRSIYHWKVDQQHATYLISIVAGQLDAGHGMWGKMPVDYYVPKGLLPWGDASFGRTEDIIDFYSKLTGFNYPYAKFCQSAVPDFMFGGMENITAVTQTITALHPKSTEPVNDATGLVAHELAHQWFGDTITCNGWSDAWLNEGFATFLPHFWDRKKYGQENFDLGRYGDFQAAIGAHQGQKRPVVWAGYKDALDMFNGFIYPGGSARMFMLMDMLGEERFWKAISAYLNERKFTSFDTPAFFDSMSRASGVDLKPFMQQWFYTPAAPDLTVSERDGKLVITQPEPYFNLKLDVWTLDGGSWFKKKVEVSGHETTLELGNQAGKPVLIDPRCFVMATIHNNIPFSVDERINLFKNAPNAGEQARILDTMMDGLTQDQWLAIAEGTTSPNILQRLIGRVGKPGEGFLIQLTKGANRQVANAAAGVLGGLPKSPAIVEQLTALWEKDPNESIRSTALHSLVALTNDEALVKKAWSMDGYADEFRRFALGWLQGHAADEAREKCLDILAHPTSEPLRVDAIRMLGGLKDKPGETRVYSALTDILKETSFGARSTAIYALMSYGNPEAIKLLEPFRTNSLVFFRQAAEGAIGALSAKH